MVSLFRIIIEGEPISKSNATMSRFNWKTRKSEVFVPEKYLLYEQRIANEISKYLSEFPNLELPLFPKGPVIMNIVYFLSTKRKKDLPNLPKTTCDALQNKVYTDDSQIVLMTLRKFYDKDNPRVIIEVLPCFEEQEWPIPKTLLPEPEEKPPKPKKTRKKQDATRKPKSNSTSDNISKPRRKNNKKNRHSEEL
jgi:Holliday junction resolvase RusA-like endonuclease